jgi:hypothetical protein
MELAPINRHVSDELPRHPLSQTPMVHPLQVHSMIIRIHPDADRMYSDDQRWTDADDAARLFAFNILTKITGQEFPVVSMVTDNGSHFYNIIVRPKVQIHDTLGRPISVGYAFVPADYCITTRSHGCPEAR